MFKGWKKSKPQAVQPTVELGYDTDHSSYDVVASLLSDVGCVREVNEDSGRYTQPEDQDAAAEKGMLFLVADGMGGHSAGEVASRMAVEVITRVYYQESAEAREALEAAFHSANRAIHEASTSDQSLGGMGTTCTALVIQNGTALAAHVGDSRLYLIRNGEIYLMTEDHSAVMEMVKRGWISLQEARHHPEKNVILRALGSHPDVEVTTWDAPFPVRAGDRFLLCSDGLYDLVEDEEIKQVVLASEPHSACENLIDLARQRGGHDNITVAVVSLEPAGVRADRPVPVTREARAVVRNAEVQSSAAEAEVKE